MASEELDMSEVYDPPEGLKATSHVKGMQEYHNRYSESVSKPVEFWGEIAKEFHWQTTPTAENFLEYNFDVRKGPIDVKWMKDGVTNICYNCLDRHLPHRGSQVAFYWEGNDLEDENTITYDQLFREVCQFANVLKKTGIKKGDRVAIYMPMIPELVVAMLACARIGAVHSIVFGGYSSESLASRIIDGGIRILVTADGVWRGNKLIHLLEVVDQAMLLAKKAGHAIEKNVVVRHLARLHHGNGSASEKEAYEKILATAWNSERDSWWEDDMKEASDQCDVEWMDAEDPLFILYTSGSTGKPKGVLHSVAGYMIYSATTFKYTFDHQPDDIFWCTADIGWITGHSYVTYGPLLNGATSVLFEGTPFYPSTERFWQIVQKYKVTKFYTAPTAIRALMKFGEGFVGKYDLSTLKVLGTVGEPINPEAWLWYNQYVGNFKAAIVDTYWQTETGGHVLTPLPGCTPTKPGSACFPFFGVVPVILDEEGKEMDGPCEGYIAFKQPWPGIMRTVYGDHNRFEHTYFSRFPGYYMAGDGAKRDSDGYIWVTGRIDDMINCSGHLMSTAQVESALVEHPEVIEAAVVSCPHPVKGECLYCFITPKAGVHLDPIMTKELRNLVREKIAPFASPDYIQEAQQLPKTRSGKIMRRILRKIAANDTDLGDTSTMADSSIIPCLQSGRTVTVGTV